jgi:hypothetical protein
MGGGFNKLDPEAVSIITIAGTKLPWRRMCVSVDDRSVLRGKEVLFMTMGGLVRGLETVADTLASEAQQSNTGPMGELMESLRCGRYSCYRVLRERICFVIRMAMSLSVSEVGASSLLCHSASCIIFQLGSTTPPCLQPGNSVSHCVGLGVYDPGSIPSSLTHRLIRTGPSAHNVSRRRYRSQFP